jgi:hypothetical protein
MFVLGRGREKDEQAGMNLFWGACSMSYGPASDGLWQAMGNGWGVPADP